MCVHLSSSTASPPSKTAATTIFLVSTQTSSPTYLVLQLHLHKRQQPRQSCLHTDFQSHLPCFTAISPSKTATTTILSASRLPVPPIFSHSHTSRQQPRQSCQQADFQSHLPCSTATPPSKTAATTILPASGVPIPPSISMPRVMFCQDAKEEHRVTTTTCLTNSLLSAPLTSTVVKHIHPHCPLHHPIPKLS